VLDLLSRDQWQVKLSKCRFAQQSIAYLGHVISATGVATDPSKVESIRKWPVPTDSKQLRSFLGLAGYYRKFVRHFAILARPLTNLLKKGTLFIWTPDHDAAFFALQQALISTPVLALPDFSKQFQIHTDASDAGVGAVLIQEAHPIAFVSKALGPRTRGLSTYEKSIWQFLWRWSNGDHIFNMLRSLSIQTSVVLSILLTRDYTPHGNSSCTPSWQAYSTELFISRAL